MESRPGKEHAGRVNGITLMRASKDYLVAHFGNLISPPNGDRRLIVDPCSLLAPSAPSVSSSRSYARDITVPFACAFIMRPSDESAAARGRNASVITHDTSNRTAPAERI